MTLYTIGPKTQGKDFNFFQKVTVTATTFASAPDLTIRFVTQSVMFNNEGSGATSVIEYSFNGTTVHGEMDPTKASANLLFENRVVSMVWFRFKSGSSGSAVVRVEAWSIR